MNRNTVKCPYCGTVNKNLILEETDGWLECEHCRKLTRSKGYIRKEKMQAMHKAMFMQMMHVFVI